MDADTLSVGYLIGLFAVVSFGSTIPVVPTGAAVSVAAVLAAHDRPLELVAVVLVGAAGAYVGDIVTYTVLSFAGEPLAQRIGWLSRDRPADALDRLRRRMESNELRVLLLSRLVPAGRIPVLMGAALGGYSWRRYAVADLGAATLWAFVYALIGLAGRSIFPRPWEGVLAAIAIVVALSLAGAAFQRHRRVTA